MDMTATAVMVGAAFGLAGVLVGPIRINARTRPRALRGLAVSLAPILVWLLCGGPILPTMLAFCVATLALGEWRARGRITRKGRAPAKEVNPAPGPEGARGSGLSCWPITAMEGQGPARE